MCAFSSTFNKHRKYHSIRGCTDTIPVPFTLLLYAWLSFSFCFLPSFLPSCSTLLCFSTSLFPLSSWLFFRRFYEIPSRIHGTSCPMHVVNYRVEERSRTLSSESLPPWTRNSSLEDSIVPPCISRMLTIPRTIVGLYHRSSSSRYGASNATLLSIDYGIIFFHAA